MSQDSARILTTNREQLLHDVMGDSLVLGSADGYVKDWKINGEKVTLGVKKNS